MGPTLAHGDDINRKGWYPILLQAMCDNQYIITDLNVGWPGKVHNAMVFGNSELYYKGENNWTKQLRLPDKQVSMPVVIVADAAYSEVMAAKAIYAHCLPLEAQKHFNYRLRCARMTIENTFGRWRWLMKRMDVDIVDISIVLTTCAILDNMRNAPRTRHGS